MENFLVVAREVIVLFILMGTGFVSRRIRLLTECSMEEVINFLLIVINPCLILHAFDRTYDPAMLRGFLIAIGLATLTHFILMALVSGVFRKITLDTRVVLKSAAVFSNAGFIGIPLEQAVLGTAGVFYGAAYIVTFNIFMWSWGFGINREGRFALSRRMILNPGMLAVIGGLVLFFMPGTLPRILGEPLSMFAAVNTPLAMVVIGYYLAGAQFARVFRTPAAYLAMVIRLLVCPLLVLGMLYLLRASLDETMMIAVIIPAATPTAAMVSMFAAKFKRDVDLSVALVSGTTLLSILTMPVLIALAMAILTVA